MKGLQIGLSSATCYIAGLMLLAYFDDCGMSAHPVTWNFTVWILQSFLLDSRFYIGILSTQVYQWLKGKHYHKFWKEKMEFKLKWLGFYMTMNILFQHARAHISPHIMSTTEYLCIIYWNNAKCTCVLHVCITPLVGVPHVRNSVVIFLSLVWIFHKQ